MRDAEPWFVAADICRILGIKNTADGLKNLDDDEKGIALSDTLRGIQEVLVVSESGLWTLVLRSRDAVRAGTVPHRFRRWITGEVIPTIRRTGGYTLRRPQQAKLTQEKAALSEMRARTAQINAISRSLEVICRSAGRRPAALAAPDLYAAIGVKIDLTGSDALAQAELPLATSDDDGDKSELDSGGSMH
jgi:prophage antirepressor-like protein